MNEDGPWCGAKYCRSLAVPGKKYCQRHDSMTGKETLEDGKPQIRLSWDQVEILVDYALRELMKKGKG